MVHGYFNEIIYLYILFFAMQKIKKITGFFCA